MKPYLLLALLGGAGCAWTSPGPTLAQMQVDRRCHAWFDNGTGHISARVERQQAIVHGGGGETAGALFETPVSSEITVRGTLVGSYAAPMLTLKGAGEPVAIGPHSATLARPGGDFTVEYNHACSDREAALGVASLFIALAGEHWH